MDASVLRSASRAADILQIVDLWVQIGDAPIPSPSRQDIETRRILMRGLDYLVCRDDATRKIIGAVSIVDYKDSLAGISSLVVAPRYQSRGHGRGLMVSALDLCRQKKYQEVTALATPASQELLTSLGFETNEWYRSGNAAMSLDLS